MVMRMAVAEGVDFVSTGLINIGSALPMKPSMHQLHQSKI